jgi:hypothetical protein
MGLIGLRTTEPLPVDRFGHEAVIPGLIGSAKSETTAASLVITGRALTMTGPV